MSAPENSIFGWSKDGIGQKINRRSSDLMSHEILFEEEFSHVQDRPLYVGIRLPPWRFLMAFVLGFGLVFGLMGRAFWMQIPQGNAFQERAEANRLRHLPIQAKRGIIRDRNGVILAENIPSFDLEITPWYLPADKATQEEVLGRIGRTVGMSLEDLKAIVGATSTDPLEPIVVKRDIPYESAIGLKLIEGDPATHLVIGQKRRYPLSTELPSLSHVLGYVGSISPAELKLKKPEGYRQTDLIGKTGLESSYEAILRGTYGEEVFEVDAQNRQTSLVSQHLSEDGQDLRLSLDIDIQRAAELALREELEKEKLFRGSVVAIDPRDGSVLAIVSLPAYDDNLFSGTVSSTYYKSLLADENRPLLPRAWAGVFPSGSTVKPVVAIAALTEGVIKPNTTVQSSGGIHIGNSFFPDWKPGGHGTTNVRWAIAQSVNTFFYTIGGGYQSFTGLGVDRLTDWMRRFGLGAKSGIDLPSEGAGFVPSREWKERVRGERWYIGDTYNLSIGQGDLLVTPLQVAQYTAEVANGGLKVTPKLGPITSGAVSTTRIADAAIVEVVRAGMRDTVTVGSGRALSNLPFEASGKTGTAQWRNDRPSHAWFTTYAPSAKPEIVVTVLLEEGIEGSRTAVPVAKKVLEAWWKTRAVVDSR